LLPLVQGEDLALWKLGGDLTGAALAHLHGGYEPVLVVGDERVLSDERGTRRQTPTRAATSHTARTPPLNGGSVHTEVTAPPHASIAACAAACRPPACRRRGLGPRPSRLPVESALAGCDARALGDRVDARGNPQSLGLFGVVAGELGEL
jgi:hypothetical protein